MTDTSQLWYSLNKDCSDISKTPVELSLDSKEQTNIFVLCPRGRCRVDRYSQLQKYLKENYNTTLIIKSQKTK